MQHKLYLITLLYLVVTIQIYARDQKTDSLLNLVNNTEKVSKKAEYLNELGNLYRYTNIDSAFKYTTKAKTLAKQNNLPVQLAESLNELGILWYKRKENDSAFHYLNKGYQVASQNNDYRGIVKSMTYIGQYKIYAKDYNKASETLGEALLHVDKVTDPLLLSMLYNANAILHKRKGNTDLALENYHKSLQVSEVNKLTNRIGITTSNIGLLYESQNKTELALKYLNRSLEIRLKEGNRIGESYVRTNLGVVYENLKEYDKALEQYKKSLIIKKEINNKKSIAILYNNIGIIYKKQSLLDSAHYYCTNALDLRIQLKDKLGEARTRTTIGQINYLEGENSKAVNELSKALELASGFRNYSVLQNIYSSLSNVYAKQGNYKKAMTCLQQNYAYKDSIFNIQKERSIAGIEAKYNTLKKEQENLLLLKENDLKEAKLKRQLIISIGLGVLIVMVGIWLILAYRSRHKLAVKNKEIEQQSEELYKANSKLKKLAVFKETMTNMLVHDLKNPLNVIVNYKDLKDLESIDDLVQQSAYNMQNLVYNILDVYKYQDTKLTLNIDTLPLSYILNHAFEEVLFLKNEKKLNFEIIAETDYLLDIDANLLKRVFVNLFTNAIRFTPNGENIIIKTETAGRKSLRIAVINPGPGIPKEKQELIFEHFKQAERVDIENVRSTGIGLSFCKLAVEAHKGEIGVISETPKGVEFWFTLPAIKEEIPFDTDPQFTTLSSGSENAQNPLS